MDLSNIFSGEALTYEQFTEKTKEMKLADLSTGEYVAKGKYDSDLKKAKDDLKEAKDTITQLQESAGDVEGMKAKLEEYKKADEARQKAEQEAAAHAAMVERFSKVKGEKEFSSQYAENGVFEAFQKAVSDATNTGKGDAELFESLTKDIDGVFKNPQQVSVQIPHANGGGFDSAKINSFMSAFKNGAGLK